jgi:hypothetical protein
VTKEAPIQNRYELQESEEMKVVAMNRMFLILLLVGLILTPSSAVAQDSLNPGLELASMDRSSQGNISMAKTKKNQIATVIHIAPHDLFVKIPDKGKIRMISVAYCPSLEFKDWRCAHTGTMQQIFAKGLRQMSIEKDADDFELLQIVRVFDSDDSRVSSLWFSYIEKKAISTR